MQQFHCWVYTHSQWLKHKSNLVSTDKWINERNAGYFIYGIYISVYSTYDMYTLYIYNIYTIQSTPEKHRFELCGPTYMWIFYSIVLYVYFLLWFSQKYFLFGAPGWFSGLSIWLRLGSWSHSSRVWAPCRALCWELRAWSLLRILCLPLSLPAYAVSVSQK